MAWGEERRKCACSSVDRRARGGTAVIVKLYILNIT
jgi:hypothetical protein